MKEELLEKRIILRQRLVERKRKKKVYKNRSSDRICPGEEKRKGIL